MPVSLERYILTSLPKKSPPMTRDELVQCLDRMEQDYDTGARLITNSDAKKLLSRLLLGVRPGTIDIPSDSTPQVTIELCDTLAARVIDLNQLLFIVSDLIADVLNSDIEDLDPSHWNFVHLLQVKSGWSLTAFGAEDCLYLGDDDTCCIFNGELTSELEQMNAILSEKHDSFTLTDEMPFLVDTVNPLDTISWRDERSTQMPFGVMNRRWTNDIPIRVADVPHLEKVYAKLDETTEYKNALVAQLMALRDEHEELKEQTKQILNLQSENTRGK